MVTEGDESNIWMMAPDGSRKKQLTHGGADRNPKISPDGKEVLFTSRRDGKDGLYILDIRTLATRVLSAEARGNHGVAWSRDGGKICAIHQTGKSTEIWTVNRDGANARLVYSQSGRPGGIEWIPETERVILARETGANWSPTSEIYTIRSDGSDLRRLTHDRVADRGPVVSPEGKRVLYARSHGRGGYGDYRLHIMDIDGGNKKQLVANASDTRNASWSPDAAKVVFDFRNPRGDWDIAVAEADGTGIVSIAFTSASETDPHWGAIRATTDTGSAEDKPAKTSGSALWEMFKEGLGISEATEPRAACQVWAWGHNGHGGLGDGTTTHRLTPTRVQGLSGVTAVAGGQDYTLALRSDGTVWAWGYNGQGQLGDGTRTDHHTPVRVPGLSGVIRIAAGGDKTSGYHSAAVKKDGTVWTWGSNNHGQLGDGTTRGRLTPARVRGLAGVRAVSVGQRHTVVLKRDGTVWGWGYNYRGQLGDGHNHTDRHTAVRALGLGGVVAIAAGAEHTMALKQDGTVWCWGRGNRGQVGTISKGNQYTPGQVPGLTGAVAIAAGGWHSAALKGGGSVWTWGHNGDGQLGNGGKAGRQLPARVPGLSGIKAIACGCYHTVALKNDGTVWGWGGGAEGRLGDGKTTARQLTPVRASRLRGVAAIAAGSYHTLALVPSPPAKTALPADKVEARHRSVRNQRRVSVTKPEEGPPELVPAKETRAQEVPINKGGPGEQGGGGLVGALAAFMEDVTKKPVRTEAPSVQAVDPWKEPLEQLVRNNKLGCSITVPKSWRFTGNRPDTLVMRMERPNGVWAEVRLRRGKNYSVQDRRRMSAQQRMEEARARFENMRRGKTSGANSAISVDGREAHQYTENHEERGESVRCLVTVVTGKGGNTHELRLLTSPEQFEAARKDLFHRIIERFDVKD